jgi:hypothetical protein
VFSSIIWSFYHECRIGYPGYIYQLGPFGAVSRIRNSTGVTISARPMPILRSVFTRLSFSVSLATSAVTANRPDFTREGRREQFRESGIGQESRRAQERSRYGEKFSMSAPFCYLNSRERNPRSCYHGWLLGAVSRIRKSTGVTIRASPKLSRRRVFIQYLVLTARMSKRELTLPQPIGADWGSLENEK